MLKNVGLILAALVLTANTDAAVPRRSVSDEQIVAQAELVASDTYIEIYQHGVTIDPVFLKVMEIAYERGAERHWVEAGHGNPRAQASRLRVGCNKRLARMEGIRASDGSKSHHFP
jgi:hypothetical protein